MAVTVISAAQMPARPIRVMLYGVTRIGKTTAAASFPKPLFLSAGQEGGDTTLRAFPEAKIIHINSSQQMLEAIEYLKRNPQICETVVIDSLTFYSDIVLGELGVKAGAKGLAPKDWGILDNHIVKHVSILMHQLRQHVVWIALENVMKDEERGAIHRIEPMLYGKQAQKMPAMTDMIIRMALHPVMQDGRVSQVPIWQVSQYGNFLAGGRYGQAFPEGLLWPHFDALAERIGPYIGAQPSRQLPPPPPLFPGATGAPSLSNQAPGFGQR